MGNFLVFKDFLKEGDIAIVYFSPSDIRSIKIKKDFLFHTHLGTFDISVAIGKPYGSKIYSTDSKKYIILLHPTPELWTLALPHRTQILYLADISFITWMLRLKPGSVVVESGTGSGSFTHSLARTVFPDGHVFTFEFHHERFQAAKQEFEEHNLSSFVTITHADVIENGFRLQSNTENAHNDTLPVKADAVFLDLPKPWEAIAHAKQVLQYKSVGRICCFSPCIEQVQKTVLELDNCGFKDIVMYECLIKDFSVIKRQLKYFKCETSNAESDAKRIKIESRSIQDNLEECVLLPPNESRGHTSYLTFATLYSASHIL